MHNYAIEPCSYVSCAHVKQHHIRQPYWMIVCLCFLCVLHEALHCFPCVLHDVLICFVCSTWRLSPFPGKLSYACHIPWFPESHDLQSMTHHQQRSRCQLVASAWLSLVWGSCGNIVHLLHTIHPVAMSIITCRVYTEFSIIIFFFAVQTINCLDLSRLVTRRRQLISGLWWHHVFIKMPI